MSQTFVVIVPVKPYVKRFIEINFGSPARFTSNADVNKFFLSLLRKPDSSKDKRYPEQLFNYTVMMEVAISQHDFYHYGWELERTCKPRALGGCLAPHTHPSDQRHGTKKWLFSSAANE